MIQDDVNLVCFDLETYRFGPGVKAPKPVCVSYDRGAGGQVVLWRDGLPLVREWVLAPEVTVVNQNIVYDLAVTAAREPALLAAIWRKIRDGRARCILVREKMIANARGELKYEWDEELDEWKKSKFGLDALSWKYLRKFRKKGADSWQQRYSELDGVPVDQWPEDAVKYPIEDAEGPRTIFLLQEELVGEEGIPHEADVLETAWALELAGVWGSRTEPRAVEEFCAELDAAHAAAVKRAQDAGLVRANGTRDMGAIKDRVSAWHRARGLDVPMTESGKNVSTDRDTLTAAKWRGTHEPDPGLLAVSEVVKLEKRRSTYAPILRHGTRWPVTPSYNVPIETYRTSCARPNMQNLPRKGGMRDCFVPRPWAWFAFCDYDTLEMRTLAQACLDLVGYSTLAEALRAGLDPHVEIAAQILEIPSEEAQARYSDGDEEVGNARQFGKIGNYGLGGGMGEDAFIEYARGYGLEISWDLAHRIKRAYLSRWEEMPEYFAYCSDLAGPTGEGQVVFPRSGLIRGNVRYTAICNGFFQHPAAMGATAALRHASRECYLDESSALYGSRPWYFGHDEIGLEVPAREDLASPAAERLQAVMEEEMQVWTPDVPIRASVVISRRWYKGAKAQRRGRFLVPTRQEGKNWVIDLPN